MIEFKDILHFLLLFILMRRSQGRGNRGTIGSTKLYKFHLTFLVILSYDIQQSRRRKSLEKTLFCLSFHLEL